MGTFWKLGERDEVGDHARTLLGQCGDKPTPEAIAGDIAKAHGEGYSARQVLQCYIGNSDKYEIPDHEGRV